jgi:hypothetical protein
MKHSFPLGSHACPFIGSLPTDAFLSIVKSSSYALMQAIEPTRINAYRRAFESHEPIWVPKHMQPHWRVTCIGSCPSLR